MAKFDLAPDNYKPFPRRTWLVQDPFGNDAYYFTLVAKSIGVISEDNPDDEVPCVFSDYETNLEIDFEKFPKIWSRLQSLLQFDQDEAFVLRTADEMFKEINSIENIGWFYFPKPLLNNGKISWLKYDIYKKFRNAEEGYNVLKHLEVAITKESKPLIFWFLGMVYEARQNAFITLTEEELLHIASPHDKVIRNYIHRHADTNLTFATNFVDEADNDHRLFVLLSGGEPVMYFIIENEMY